MATPPAGIQPSDKVTGTPGQAMRRCWWQRPLLVGTAILVLAAGLRIAHFQPVAASSLGNQLTYLFDATYYDQQARRLIATGRLTDDVFFMTPLYPAVLAGMYRLAGGLDAEAAASGEAAAGAVRAAGYVQCIWGAVTCVLIYLLGRRLAGDLAGLIAGGAAAAYGPFIFHDGLLLATQLVTFLNVAALLVLVRAGQSGGQLWWVLGGGLLALCIVAHGTALLLVPGIVLWILVDAAGQSWRARLWRCVPVLVLPAAAVLGVALRNHHVGQDWVPLTSNSGLAFYIGNGPGATGTFRPLPPEDAGVAGANLEYRLRGWQRGPNDPRPSAIARLFRAKAWDTIAADPVGWAGLLWQKARLFWNAVEFGSHDQYYFCGAHFSPVLRGPVLTFGLIGPLGLVGAVYALRRWRTYLLVYAWLASQVAAYTLTFVLGRFRLVAVACLLVLAGAQAAWWVEQWRARRRRAVLLSLVPLSVLVVFVHLVIPGFDRQRGYGGQYRILAVQELRAGSPAGAIRNYEQALRYDFAPFDEAEKRIDCLTWLAQLYGDAARPNDAARAAREALELLDARPVNEETRAQRALLQQMYRKAQAGAEH